MTEPVKSSSSTARRSSPGRFRPLVVLLVLFILIEGAVSGLVWFSSLQAEEDSARVVLIARQRELSQRLIKCLYQLRDYQLNNRSLDEPRKELKYVRDAFEATIRALRDGGTVPGLDGLPCHVSPPSELAGQKLVSDAQLVWDATAERVAPVLAASESIDPVLLQNAIDYANGNNLRLLGQMNDLTVLTLNHSHGLATQWRLVETGLLVVLLFQFFISLAYFLRCFDAAEEVRTKLMGAIEQGHAALDQADADISAAAREHALILSVVPSGLFGVDRERRLCPPFSGELSRLLGPEEWATLTFEQVLQRHLPAPMYRPAADYVDQLFDAAQSDAELEKINPLDEIAITVPAPAGGTQRRVVTFRFRRLNEEGRIVRLLVTMQDVSAKVASREQLRELREKTANMISTPNPVPVPESSSSWLQPLDDEVKQLALRLGKPAALRVDSRLWLMPPPQDLESAVNEALNYLAQHSLAAAIEPAVERARQNKAAEAALEVAPWNGVEGWGFIWRDDGAGLDLAVLRERAVELGLKTTEEAKELPSGEVAQLIFSPGFVRANPDAPELSSALATLNRRVIEEKGGEIQVSSRAGRFTEFRVRWPECG